ncbi:MAG: transcriptional coactivator p15/PC4 family protein [Candidatus Riflebacteria bacterium]|nr:transcriptional coactivator p15/PC4 family protein [Candidatus Riflebacteria bacterium]
MEKDQEPRAELNEVAKMTKNSMADIIFSLTEHNGKTYFDIREFSNTSGYKGPTKKGLRVNAELIEEFLGNVEKLRAAIKK